MGVVASDSTRLGPHSQRRSVGSGRGRLDQEQGVVDLDVRIAELEPLERLAGLTVCGAKEVARGGALLDGLLQDRAMLQAREVRDPSATPG